MPDLKNVLAGTGAFALVIGSGASLWMGIPIISVLGPVTCVILAVGSLDCTFRSKQSSRFEKMRCELRGASDTSQLGIRCLRVFGTLNAQDQVELLTEFSKEACSNRHCTSRYCVPVMCLEWLFEKETLRNQGILKSLIHGLPFEQRIELIDQVSSLVSFSHWMIDLNTLIILFGNIRSEQRFRLLTIVNKEGVSVFMQWVVAMTRCSSSAIQKELINFLLAEFSEEQLKALLTQRATVSCLSDEPWPNVTALNIAVRTNSHELANLLIQYGAIEADPECDFQALTESPNFSVTPYRDKLKQALKASACLKSDVIEDLVCDYIVGNAAPRAMQ